MRKEITKDTKEILGYSYWALGSYTLSGDQLHIRANERYSSNNPEPPYYAALEDLQLLDGSEEYTVSIDFEDHGNKLIFTYPPCGDNENCIGSQTFQRE